MIPPDSLDRPVTSGTSMESPEADVTNALPRQFGRYLLFDKIGEGGMARIYLGRQRTELGGERLAVVKQMLPFLSSSREFSSDWNTLYRLRYTPSVALM